MDLADLRQLQLEEAPLTRDAFTRVVDDEFRCGFDGNALKLLREKAGRERDLRELYRGRAPHELLQNADDAGASRAVFITTDDGLAFIHDGNWFTVANFRSLADGWSDKDPAQCIGHKGLGFRSVLDITPAPHVLKLDPNEFFGFKFTWALNDGFLQEILRRNPRLHKSHSHSKRHGQSVCPVMYVPGEVKRHGTGMNMVLYELLSRGRLADGYTTMFWFPAVDPDANESVIEELGVKPIVADTHGRRLLTAYLRDDVSDLIPFLSSVRSVDFLENESVQSQVRLDRDVSTDEGGEIKVRHLINRKSTVRSYFQMSFPQKIPAHIKGDAHTPKAVRAMKEADLRLSVRLEDGRPSFEGDSRFHVYFPTDETTGLGFLVHGDFHVMPDRTHLMKGAYNTWLLSHAATNFAGPFLTELLRRYDPKSVFAALRPSGSASTPSASQLRSACSEALVAREEPFVPTEGGLAPACRVLVPPTTDIDGFCSSHFADLVEEHDGEIRSFLDPSADSHETRKFLAFAGLDFLESRQLLKLVESGGEAGKASQWWVDCYEYISRDPVLSLWSATQFAGHPLILNSESEVIAVPGEDGPLVCLPHEPDDPAPLVPTCFQESFTLIHPEVASLLLEGDERTEAWARHSLRLRRFEATELLPGAVRNVVTRVFGGDLQLTAADVMDLWAFLKNNVDRSRTIESSEFWKTIGRLPLPLTLNTSGESPLLPSALVPAFLAYWPDELLEGVRALTGLQEFRRVSLSFLTGLATASDTPVEEWMNFLERAGVSDSPKILHYVRGSAASQKIALVSSEFSAEQFADFRGERQRDENDAVIENLSREGLWKAYAIRATDQGIQAGATLRSLTLVDGFAECARQASAEFDSGDPSWRDRLDDLTDSISEVIHTAGNDSVYSTSQVGGVSSLENCGYVDLQLDTYAWLPASSGPASRTSCFARMEQQRLIRRGNEKSEIGDQILPYVVATSHDSLARYERLGVDSLNQARAAKPAALIRALTMIGERLSREPGTSEIFKVDSRWRLVRGAIQEIYRGLNTIDEPLGFPDRLLLAARNNGQIEFLPRPLHFASPGSPVERAFEDKIPMLDADRVLNKLLDALSIAQLRVGENVKEEFLDAERAAPNSKLRSQILEQLCPYLLATLVARSNDDALRGRIEKRLEQRFQVQTVDRLRVQFTFADGDSLEEVIDYESFYLHQYQTEEQGAVKKNHYILYVKGHDEISFEELDGDALGDALEPVFFGNRTPNDFTGLFPRISTRLQLAMRFSDGSPTETAEAMQAFMHQRLGVSIGAQEQAQDKATNSEPAPPPLTSTPPPKPRHVKTTTDATSSAGSSRNDALSRHDSQITDKTASMIDEIGRAAGAPPAKRRTRSAETTTGGHVAITRDQEVRGKKGEEEFLRRVSLPGGWEGFTLIDDRRADGCGYDFLCNMDGQIALVEVKTFSRDGRVFVTRRELHEAAKNERYYMIGFLDEGEAYSWQSYVLRDPVNTLLEKGVFQIETKLEVPAMDLFAGDQ